MRRLFLTLLAGAHAKRRTETGARTNRPTAHGVAVHVGLVVSPVAATTAIAVSSGTRQIPSGGTTTIRAGWTGVDGIQQPQIREGSDEDEGAGSSTGRGPA